MSSMFWHDNILVQRLMSHTEELGRLNYDSFTETYVLWLKDHWGRFGPKGGHFRGDEFASFEEGREKGASSVSAHIFHWMWLLDLKENNPQEAAQSIETLKEGKPLDVSTLREELRKENKLGQRKGLIQGLVLTGISILVALFL